MATGAVVVVGTIGATGAILMKTTAPPPSAPVARQPVAPTLPAELPVPEAPDTGELDRTAITDGIATVRPRIVACGDKAPGHGVVRIRAHVAPDGTIGDVRTLDAPTAELGNCVAREIERAHFRATREGGTFSYPFTF
ncbi:MAG TPA: hypothetical protein VGM88_06590 [Kofleriaceae bacterium]|jgi:hypothetical protein